MKKENFNNIKLDKSLLAGKRNYFLGSVILHDISKNIGVRDQKVYYAAFKNGAKTKIHYHEGSQILVVTHGIGVLVTYRRNKSQGRKINLTQEAKSALKSGDMVYIPRGTLHWHGAVKGKSFGHIAFNGFSTRRKEAKTIWYDSDFKSHATKIQ